MNNYTETQRMFKDAQSCLIGAEKSFNSEDSRTVVQNSQLCIELSAKGIISYFAEYDWTHDPSSQLKEIIELNLDKLKEKFTQEEINSSYELAEIAYEVSYWPGEVIYGREIEKGKWVPAVELCTKEIAEGILNKARKSFETFSNFMLKLGIDIPKL